MHGLLLAKLLLKVGGDLLQDIETARGQNQADGGAGTSDAGKLECGAAADAGGRAGNDNRLAVDACRGHCEARCCWVILDKCWNLFIVSFLSVIGDVVVKFTLNAGKLGKMYGESMGKTPLANLRT